MHRSIFNPSPESVSWKLYSYEENRITSAASHWIAQEWSHSTNAPSRGHDNRTSRGHDIKTSRHQDVNTTRHQGTRHQGINQDMKASRLLQGTKTSRHQRIKTSRHRDIKTSRHPDTTTTRHQHNKISTPRDKRQPLCSIARHLVATMMTPQTQRHPRPFSESRHLQGQVGRRVDRQSPKTRI